MKLFTPTTSLKPKVQLDQHESTTKSWKSTGKSTEKKRNLDILMEEMQRSNVRKTPTTMDNNSTNVFVGNIHPAVTEEQLMQNFVQFGPLASIRILPQRNPAQPTPMNGFVLFMNRHDAAKAIKDMDGYELAGLNIRCNWANRSHVPQKAMYVFDTDLGRGVLASQLTDVEQKQFGMVDGLITVEKPDNQLQLAVIHRTIERLIRQGPQFELELMQHITNNDIPGLRSSDFAFLFNHASREHAYFRWKLWSVLQGDDRFKHWQLENFRMVNQGPDWLPLPNDEYSLDGETHSWLGLPPVQREATPDSDSDSEEDLSQNLTPQQIRLLVQMLKELTITRQSICKCMMWCMDHSDAAQEIVDILLKSLILPATPTYPTKIARLYLLSDLLLNSASQRRNAWQFRTLFEPRLVQVFRHFGNVWGGISQRLKAEQVRKCVVSVLSSWEQRTVFAQAIMDDLRKQFDIGHEEASGKEVEIDPDLDGLPME
jgi:U2-associated protein SR140